jgi:ankyrin repeat protein
MKRYMHPRKLLVRDGDEARVRGLLARGACPRAEDSAGYTPLHYAARAGHAAIVRLLLDGGGDVNARTRAGGATPLHRAAYQGHLEVVRLLVERGADCRLQEQKLRVPDNFEADTYAVSFFCEN